MPGVGEELRPGDPERIGEYRVIDVLGNGGMGRVYLCLSPGGRRVAVKVIRGDLAADPEFLARFRAEVKTAGQVNGAYTASLLGSNLDGPQLWLATTYAGPSLAQVVMRHGPLPPRTVLALAAGLAEGLAAIHAAGVVHRDLKPSNVLLAEDGPRVIDFGISRALAGSSVVTETGTVFGSPGYMSPEQAEGLRVDARSDVFSLGAVLTYAAAGHGPFGTGEAAALLYRVVHHPPDLHDVPDGIRGLAGRCLAKAPADRPTLTELLAELGDTHLSSGWLPAHVTVGFFRDEPTPARISVGAPAPAAAAAGQNADPGADTIVRPIASAAWAPPDVRPDREPTDARPGQDPLGGPGAALIFQDADRHPNGTGLTLPYTPEPAPGRGPSGPTGPSGPDEPSRAAGLSRAGAWGRIRRLRGRRLLLAAGAGVVLIALLTTALVVLTAGPGPFHPRLRSVLTGPPSQGLTTVAFSPDNSLLAAAGNGGSGYVWTAADGRLTTTLPDPASGGVTDIAFSPAGGLLATADSNGHAFLWSATTGQLTSTLTDTGSGGLAGLAFSPHGNLLAAAGHNGQVDVWTVSSGTLAHSFRQPAAGSLTSVAFSPDGSLLAAADSNGHAYVWTVATGKITTLPDPGSGGVAAVAFSPDGSLLATADSNGRSYLWTVATGKLAATLPDPHGTNVLDVAFSPDGGLLASADGNGHTYVWTVSTGRLTATLADPGSGGVTGVAFSPDGSMLATADGDGSTYLWTTRS
jgi:sugar lactone lactonase YvrE